jgi:hypothetical protein
MVLFSMFVEPRQNANLRADIFRIGEKAIEICSWSETYFNHLSFIPFHRPKELFVPAPET